VEEGDFDLFWSWDIHLLLPVDIKTPGSQEIELHHPLLWFSGF
jgi:hypothetical protein